MTKYIFAPLLFWSVLGISPSSAQEPSDTTIYTIVEEMPFLKICADSSLTYREKRVCSDRELLKFVYSNIKFDSMDYHHEGVAAVSFVINQEGKIQDVKTVKGNNESFNARMVELVKSLPEWIPGRHRGKNVAVKLMLPIRINLKK